MAKVILAGTWFVGQGKAGQRVRGSNPPQAPVEVDDALIRKYGLPASAKLVEGPDDLMERYGGRDASGPALTDVGQEPPEPELEKDESPKRPETFSEMAQQARDPLAKARQMLAESEAAVKPKRSGKASAK